MITGKKVKAKLSQGSFVLAQPQLEMSPAQSLRVLRELQGLSQNDLEKLCGIPQSTISGMESGRINIGVERAKVLARALRVHPAVIVFPGWELDAAA